MNLNLSSLYTSDSDSTNYNYGVINHYGRDKQEINDLQMAINNTKFSFETDNFKVYVDTAKRSISTTGSSVDELKEWLQKNRVIFLTAEWKQDKLILLKDFDNVMSNIMGDSKINLLTYDTLDNVKMTLEDVELLDLFMRLE